MKQNIFLGLLLSVICQCNAIPAQDDINPAPVHEDITIYADRVISTGYIGNGVQWDPYQLDYGTGRMTLSTNDWNKLYSRLDYMRPGFIRVMINTPRRDKDNAGEEWTSVPETLSEILDYCQSRNITVMFGDWGGGFIDHKTGTVNHIAVENAVDFLEYLVDSKGYDCIKYYDFINEPNGWWSSTKGDFNLWATGLAAFNAALNKSLIAGKVGIAGPDAAIWTTDDCPWIERSQSTFGEDIALYDIHTYPSKYTVNTGEYYDIIKAYRDVTPHHKKIIMGEIGLKYVHPADSLLNIANIEAARQKNHASVSDSQMSVYKPSYGIDMADALLQTTTAGFSGAIAWMLDDAMHGNEAPDKLKIWGFWNIFGDELFGADEENIRPWYYAWSLLCRYMPAGCDIIKTSESKTGCRISVIEMDGKKTLYVLNPQEEDRNLTINSNSLVIRNAKYYIYSENHCNEIISGKINPLTQGVDYDFSNGITLDVPARTLITITNFDF